MNEGMRRRTLLSLGAIAGAAGLIGAKDAAAQLLLPESIPPDLVVRPSPPTAPFLAPLQIPQIARPIDPATLDPPPRPERHQRYNEFPPKKFHIQTLGKTLKGRESLHA